MSDTKKPRCPSCNSAAIHELYHYEPEPYWCATCGHRFDEAPPTPQTAHTPGKLHTDDFGGIYVANESGELVTDNINEANAARLCLCWNAHDDLVAALKACDIYWKACAKVWNGGDGRIGETTMGGAVVVGDNLDSLADKAALAVRAALANAQPADNQGE